MKILDSNIQEPSLVPSKSGFLKNSSGRSAEISLSFHSRFLEVLKSSKSASPEAKAQSASAPEVPVESKSNEAKASKETPVAAPVPTIADTKAPAEKESCAHEATSESEDASAVAQEVPKAGDNGNETETETVQAESASEAPEGQESEEASESTTNHEMENETEEALHVAEKSIEAAASEVLTALVPVAPAVETAKAEPVENVESVEVREVRFAAHVKLSRALSKEELEGLRAELRSITNKLDKDPAEAAADFVAVVEQLLGRAENAKHALEIPKTGEPKDLLAEGDGHLRRMLAHFEKTVRKALAREERSEGKDVREASQEIRAQLHAARSEGNAADEKAQRIVERVVQETVARRRSEPETRSPKTSETGKTVEETPKSENANKVLERILPKRAQESLRRVQEDSAETPRRAELVADMKSAVRIAAAQADVVMNLERRPNHRTDAKENPGMQISIKTEGISEARSQGSNQTPFWQNAYDQGSKRTETSFAKSAAAANQAMVPKEEIFSQIVQSARITLVDGKGEAKLQLNPEHLGRVEIRVTTEEGKAQVQVTAESQSVTQLLSDNLAELKKALEASGLEVGRLDVELGQGDLRENDEASREEHRHRHTRSNEATPAMEDDEPFVSLAWAALGRREFVA